MNYPIPPKYEYNEAPDYVSVPQYRNEVTVSMNLKPWQIEILNSAKNFTFSEIQSKARINREAGTIEISARYFKDEIEADRKAMEIYLALGYSQGEALKAFYDVFRNHAIHISSGYRTAQQQEALLQQSGPMLIDGNTRIEIKKPEQTEIKFTLFPQSAFKRTFKQRIKIMYHYIKELFTL